MLGSILKVNQDTTFEEFEKMFKEYVDFEILKREIVDITKEIDSIGLEPGVIDFENFDEEYRTSGSIAERYAVIYSKFSIYRKKYKKYFDKLVFLKMRDSDVKGTTKEDKKHFVDLLLIKYHIILDSIDYIIDKSELVKEIYLNKHTSLSRLLSYLEYKNKFSGSS